VTASSSHRTWRDVGPADDVDTGQEPSQPRLRGPGARPDDAAGVSDRDLAGELGAFSRVTWRGRSMERDKCAGVQDERQAAPGLHAWRLAWARPRTPPAAPGRRRRFAVGTLLRGDLFGSDLAELSFVLGERRGSARNLDPARLCGERRIDPRAQGVGQPRDG